VPPIAAPPTAAPRLLEPLPVPAGPGVLGALPALERALGGEGPARLLVPAGSAPPPELGAGTPLATAEDNSADPTALVVATSGSTGEPKGVLLPGSALRASATATAGRLGGAGGWLLALPAYHVGGLQVLVRSLLAGVEPVVLDLGAGFDPAAFARAARRALDRPGRRYTALVPTQLVRLLDAGGAAVEALTGFDAVLLGGAAAAPQLLERARRAGVAVVATYGMTETCGGCVYDGVSLDGVSWELAGDGRVRLRGPVLARGYRLRPDLTAWAFAGGWFTSADLGTAGPGGRLVVHGRADDVLVTGGVNVSALAVEQALAAHPAVTQAAVVGVPDVEWGQRVVAYVVPSDSLLPPTGDELRQHVARRLSRAAAPAEVRVVAALPELASGKLDRSALRALGAGSAGRTA